MHNTKFLIEHGLSASKNAVNGNPASQVACQQPSNEVNGPQDKENDENDLSMTSVEDAQLDNNIMDSISQIKQAVSQFNT